MNNLTIETEAADGGGARTKRSVGCRRKISSILFAVLFFKLSVICSVFLVTREPSCPGIGSSAEVSSMKYLKSIENRTLIGISGNLKYGSRVLDRRNPSRIYMQLNPMQVETIELLNKTQLRLWLSCALIEFDIEINQLLNSKRVSGARINLDQDIFYSKDCSLMDFDFDIPGSFRYSCNKSRHFNCIDKGTLVAVLTLDSFELEVDGNPDKIGKDEFSNEPLRCL